MALVIAYFALNLMLLGAAYQVMSETPDEYSFLHGLSITTIFLLFGMPLCCFYHLKKMISSKTREG